MTNAEELYERLERERGKQPVIGGVPLTDLHMPDMSGHDVCTAIRATPGLADLPVVFLSSDALQESIGLAMQKGATDYLLKPVNPVDLVARVKCLVRMMAARREYESLNAEYAEYRDNQNRLAKGG